MLVLILVLKICVNVVNGSVKMITCHIIKKCRFVSRNIRIVWICPVTSIGITDKYKKPIKRFTFQDCLGHYVILCNAKHHRCNEIIVDGRLYQSVERYPVVEVLYREKKIHKIKEKCGIEVLDITWRRNARRRKEAAAYIKQHMAL